ncbi:hypothetical protein FOY91_11420 [Sphingomonas solaris]|uniref:Uncharacterized protein n=2 Tax=Alterirhizorhabdus solaris TaxID=2529389 RepID=A0A558R3A2_9SPHN|nr:hypothetical protein FOY91_11420 [Sphingomonas solaris]
MGLAVATLSACAKDNQFDETGGVRITRSACPALAVPAYTGDITLFDPPASREARAIDVVANLTDLRANCNDAGEQIVSQATFAVQARRTNTAAARDVTLPFFATVVRGGSVIVSKQVGRVALHFDAGQARATATATATTGITRAAATLPPEIETQLTRKRKPTDADASIDPMADPATRAAVAKASFEMLIGFQLSNEQLAYNVTR